MFHAADGGTMALDWLASSDGEFWFSCNDILNLLINSPFSALEFWAIHGHSLVYIVSRGSYQMQNSISKEDTTPIAVVIPGLTSDSSSPVSFLFQPILYNTLPKIWSWNLNIFLYHGTITLT